MVGVSFSDANIKEIGVSEFIDNELYSNFEVIIIIPIINESNFSLN